MSAARIRWAAFAVAVVLVVVGVVLALGIDSGGPTVTGGGRLGSRPQFTVASLSGEELSPATLAGQTVVVNFWNTWCIPCINEAPALAAFHERHAGEDDFVMVGIVRDEPAGEAGVRAHMEREGIAYDVAMDPGSRAALAFGVTGQPETFVLSADGVVAGEQRGEVTLEDLELMLRAARGQL